MQQPNAIMIATCRNLATDRVFEETERSLFLRKEDSDSRIEAYVAVDPTISSDWHELSPVVDLSDADSVQFEALLEKKPFKLATDASGSVSSATKVALQSLDALRRYTETSHPLCAFFIRKRNSYSALSVSSEFFDQLCKEISIPQAFRDYIVYFGRRQYEVEFAPPPFTLEVSSLCRSKSYPAWEAMGVIRFIEENSKVNEPNPSGRWSIRQTALFSRFDQQQSRATWLFVSLSSSAEALLDDIWASSEQETQCPWRTLHALYFYAACNWRPYVVALMHEVEQHEMRLLGTSPNNTGPVPLPETDERQALFMLEKQI